MFFVTNIICDLFVSSCVNSSLANCPFKYFTVPRRDILLLNMASACLTLTIGQELMILTNSGDILTACTYKLFL